MRFRNSDSEVRLRVLATIGAIVISFLLLALPPFLTRSDTPSEMAVRQRPAPTAWPQYSQITTPSGSHTPTAAAGRAAPPPVETTAIEFSAATPDEPKEIVGIAVVQRLLLARMPEAHKEEVVIRVGDTVKSEANTRVQLRLVDGSSIELGPNSTLRIAGFSVSKGYGKLYHAAGTVKLVVRNALLSWQLDTPSLTVLPRLEGTAFTVEVIHEGSRLAVASGVVFARRGDQALTVGAGEVLEADSHNTLTLRPAATPPATLPSIVTTATRVVLVTPTRTPTSTQFPPTLTPVPTDTSTPTPLLKPPPTATEIPPTAIPTATETPLPTATPTVRPTLAPATSASSAPMGTSSAPTDP